jgi:hypothetical protein
MSLYHEEADDEQAKRELEQIRDSYEGTPFAEMAEEWLADLETEGDA